MPPLKEQSSSASSPAGHSVHGLRSTRPPRRKALFALPSLAVVLIALGALLRFLSLALLSGLPLDPDAGAYMALVKTFSWAEPWAASYGEPLWIGLLKVTTAPFDYSPLAGRIFTTLLSLVALVLAWRLFDKVLARFAAHVALAFMALNGLLVFIAPRVLREELVLVLLLSLALAAVRWRRREAPAFWMAVPVALLSVVRLEMALFTLGLLVILAVVATDRRRQVLSTLGLTVLLIGVLAGPWLVANSHRFDDAFHHSTVSATWFRNRDLAASGGPRYSPLGGPPVTWTDYYLDFLGPAESAQRFVVGLPVLTVAVFYSSVFPIRTSRLVELAPQLATFDVIPLLKVVAALFVIFCFVMVAIGVLIPERKVLIRSAALVAILGIAAYAPLSRHLFVNYRLVAFTLAFWALVVGIGVEWAWNHARNLRNVLPRRTSATNR